MHMLKITDVLLKSLPLTKEGCDVINPILKIKVGDKHIKTSRAYGSNGNFFFPEDYEIAVNELLYLEGLLKIEIDIYDIVKSKQVFVGNCSKKLNAILPEINAHHSITMNIKPVNISFQGTRTPEMHFNATIKSDVPTVPAAADAIETSQVTEILAVSEVDELRECFEKYKLEAVIQQSELEYSLTESNLLITEVTNKYETILHDYRSLMSDHQKLLKSQRATSMEPTRESKWLNQIKNDAKSKSFKF